MSANPEKGGQENDSWHTSDTFQSDIYSGDEKKFREAFKRFVDVRYSSLFYQIKSRLPSIPDLDIAAICNGVLTELYRDIWRKGWRHPKGIRFRNCVHQLARDAISEARRKLARNLETQLDDSIFEESCGELTQSFILSELLMTIEDRVKRVTKSEHWNIYQAWKQREGLAATNIASVDDRLDQENPVYDDSNSVAEPLSVRDRQVLHRIRTAIRAEVEKVAEREGWDVHELF